METFSALLAICAGNSPVPGEFPTQRPVTRSFDVYFDLRPNKRLSKQSWGWWFETQSRPLWRHRNDIVRLYVQTPQRWNCSIWCVQTIYLNPHCRSRWLMQDNTKHPTPKFCCIIINSFTAIISDNTDNHWLSEVCVITGCISVIPRHAPSMVSIFSLSETKEKYMIYLLSLVVWSVPNHYPNQY